VKNIRVFVVVAGLKVASRICRPKVRDDILIEADLKGVDFH